MELGEGSHGALAEFRRRLERKKKRKPPDAVVFAKADLSSLGSMLQARWKSGAPAEEAKPEALQRRARSANSGS